jgi:hypothetical protein
MAASNPVNTLFQGIYENTLAIFYLAGEAFEEMSVVKLESGALYKCSGLDVPFGFVAQKATATGWEELETNGLITRVCKVADSHTPCGVYVGSNGILKTDMVIGDISAGDKLYPHATSGGYICATGYSEGATAVGIADDDLGADGIIRFRTLI